MTRWAVTFVLLLLTEAANATPLKLVRACQLDGGSRVALLAEPAVDGSRFHLKIDGRTEKAFTDMPDADFVGTVALATCVDHSLVFAISYGPPYLKGVVVRKNPENRRIERIDFAEKALPRWLYVNSKEMRLVIPNIGYEVPSRYLVYQYSAADGQPTEPLASDTLPDARGLKKFAVTKPIPEDSPAFRRMRQ